MPLLEARTTHSLTGRDRVAGYVLLALAIAVALVPRLQIAGRSDSNSLIAGAWFGAAILLLAGNSAARPSPRLKRRGAVALFVFGLVGPFIANFIDQALGAN
jgi:uncharacterized membrane protein YeaQ/YmgE (transglycosylase-associated protein family)